MSPQPSLQQRFSPLVQALQDLIAECPLDERGGRLIQTIFNLHQQLHFLIDEQARIQTEEGEEAADLYALQLFPALLAGLPSAVMQHDGLEAAPSAK